MASPQKDTKKKPMREMLRVQLKEFGNKPVYLPVPTQKNPEFDALLTKLQDREEEGGPPIEKVSAKDVADEKDTIILQSPGGREIILPRGNMNEEEWQKFAEKARKHPDFSGETRAGKPLEHLPPEAVKDLNEPKPVLHLGPDKVRDVTPTPVAAGRIPGFVGAAVNPAIMQGIEGALPRKPRLSDDSTLMPGQGRTGEFWNKTPEINDPLHSDEYDARGNYNFVRRPGRIEELTKMYKGDRARAEQQHAEELKRSESDLLAAQDAMAARGAAPAPGSGGGVSARSPASLIPAIAEGAQPPGIDAGKTEAQDASQMFGGTGNPWATQSDATDAAFNAKAAAQRAAATQAAAPALEALGLKAPEGGAPPIDFTGRPAAPGPGGTTAMGENAARVGAAAAQAGTVQKLHGVAPQPPLVPPAAQPPGAPGGSSEGASGSMMPAVSSPGFKVAQADPKYEQEQWNQYQALANAGHEAAATIRKSAQDMNEANNVHQQVALQAMKDNEQQIQIQRMAADRTLQATQLAQQHAAELSSQYQQESQKSLDPHRFWNDKTAGQRILSGIAGALFGWAGEGQQYLNRLNAAIERDIDMQKSDKASRLEGLKMGIAQANDARDFAQRAGVDDWNQRNAERLARLEGVNTYLKSIDAKALNAQQQAALANMLVGVQQNIANVSTDMVKNAQTKANEANTVAFHQAQLRQEADKTRMSWAIHQSTLAAKGTQAADLPATESTKIDNSIKLMTNLQRMKELAANGGFLDRVTRGVKEKLTSEENAKLQQYEALRMEAAVAIAESSLQKPEQEAIFPTLGERSGRFDAVPLLDEHLKTVRGSLRNRIAGFQAANPKADLSRYNQFLQPEAPQAPGYAKPR